MPGLVTQPIINSQSDVPIYRQIADWLLAAIRAGEVKPGERLPATRELAGLLGLNRATVSAAYELLEAEGLISGHVGKGSFVAVPPASALDWNRMLGPGAGETPRSTEGDDVVSFATSRPSELLFPLEEFRAATLEVLQSEEAVHILQLGSPFGYAPLRRYLLDQARQAGTAREDDDILITSGCQQALDLLERVFFPPGTEGCAAVEDPVYPGLKSVFERAGVRLAGIAVGAAGAEVEVLERILLKERPRLVVLTPNFQNPTGATMPLGSRRAVLEIVRRAGVVLIENNIYGDLRYEGEALPLIKQLDETGDTVVLGSFSKIAFPGLRVGWALGPRKLVARLAEAKQWCDLHTDHLSQAILLRFAASGRLERHRKRILEAGAARLGAVLDACARHLPAGSAFTRPQGGMNLWVRLPESIDASGLLERARQEGVSYLPGKYFAVSRVEPGALRLSFAGLEPEEIEQGVAALGRAAARQLAEWHARERLEPAPAMV